MRQARPLCLRSLPNCCITVTDGKGPTSEFVAVTRLPGVYHSACSSNVAPSHQILQR
jgi:hypothetical protein